MQIWTAIVESWPYCVSGTLNILALILILKAGLPLSLLKVVKSELIDILWPRVEGEEGEEAARYPAPEPCVLLCICGNEADYNPPNPG